MTVNVTAENDAPVALDAAATTRKDAVLSAAVHASDADGSVDHYVLDTDVGRGVLTFDTSDGTYSYDPNGAFANLGPNDSVDVTFTYHAVDNDDAASGVQTVTITVSGLSHPSLDGVTSPATFAENTVNATPQVLDSDVSFNDQQDLFNGGALTVAGLLAEDVVSIQTQGMASGEIGFASGDVYYGGTLIGTATGGAGATFTVSFNNAATADAIDALIQHLTYANTSDTPTASRGPVAVGHRRQRRRSGAAALRPGDRRRQPVRRRRRRLQQRPRLRRHRRRRRPRPRRRQGPDQPPLLFREHRIRRFPELRLADRRQRSLQRPRHRPLQCAQLWRSRWRWRHRPRGRHRRAQRRRHQGLREHRDHHQSSLRRADRRQQSLRRGEPRREHHANPRRDVDGDGDLDAVFGTFDGTIHYFENTGTAFAPAFIERTGIDNPFPTIDFGQQSTPSSGDIDGDGDLRPRRRRSRRRFPTVRKYRLGDRPGLHREDRPWPIPSPPPPASSTPTSALADVDGDGDIDLAAGQFQGGMIYVENVGSTYFEIEVDVTAENDAPTLTGLAASVTFAENTVNAAPQLIDTSVTVSDPEGNLDGGSLVVSGVLAEDTISIRDQGTGAGEIGFSGSNLTYEGVLIGTATGGAAPASPSPSTSTPRRRRSRRSPRT